MRNERPPDGRLRPLPSLPIPRAIGGRIRELRGERGWSRGDLAAELGIPLARLARYEDGKVAPPLGVLVRLSRRFAVSVDYLVTGEPEGAPPLAEGRLLERFRAIGALGEPERTMVIALLDALLAFQAMSHRRPRKSPPLSAGTPVDPAGPAR